MTHYDIVERAIIYLVERADSQPSLEEVAGHVGLSSAHFQRVFQEWAGISPKKFVQFITIIQAKQLLRAQQSLLQTSHRVGLSGTGRLHDLFITIEGMTPAEYKKGGQGLVIEYSFSDTLYGRVVVAATSKGVCFLAFCTEDKQGVAAVRAQFPHARISESQNEWHENAFAYLNCLPMRAPLKLHMKGTSFQLKVWEALLRIKEGELSTYGALAQSLDAAASSRAVGNAVGANPVPVIIPCHRVIRSSGALGGYSAGLPRKYALLMRELN